MTYKHTAMPGLLRAITLEKTAQRTPRGSAWARVFRDTISSHQEPGRKRVGGWANMDQSPTLWDKMHNKLGIGALPLYFVPYLGAGMLAGDAVNSLSKGHLWSAAGSGLFAGSGAAYRGAKSVAGASGAVAKANPYLRASKYLSRAGWGALAGEMLAGEGGGDYDDYDASQGHDTSQERALATTHKREAPPPASKDTPDTGGDIIGSIGKGIWDEVSNRVADFATPVKSQPIYSDEVPRHTVDSITADRAKAKEMEVKGTAEKTGSYTPSINDFFHSISSDMTLDTFTRNNLLAQARKTVYGVPANAPITRLLTAAGGGVLGYLASKYYGLPAIGQYASTGAGVAGGWLSGGIVDRHVVNRDDILSRRGSQFRGYRGIG